MIALLALIALLVLFGTAYRLRGNAYPCGTQSGRLLWAGAVLAGTGSPLSALGSFIGLMIPHGRWYFMQTPFQWLVIISIYNIRALLVGIPLHLCGLFGIACAMAHTIGWAFNKRTGVDPLKIAEPIIGILYAIFLTLWVANG